MVFIRNLFIGALMATQEVFGLGISHRFNSRAPSPDLDFKALTDGSLGEMPSLMFFLQGVLAQMKHDQATDDQRPVFKEEPPSQTPPDNSEAVKDKAKKDGNNGAVLGNTTGGALVAGALNAHKGPVQALCNALTVGAGSAIGPKIGQWMSDGMDDEGTPGENDDKFGKGMVAPLMGNLVGTGAAIMLGNTICGTLDTLKDVAQGVAQIAEVASAAALRQGLPAVMTKALMAQGVAEAQAAILATQINTALQAVDSVGLAGAATQLQTSLVQGAAQGANLIGAGQGAALQAPLAALAQIGTVTGMVPGMPGAVVGTALGGLTTLTGQLSTLNSLAGGLPGAASAANANIKPVIDQLHTTATEALKQGKDMSEKLKEAGKGVKDLNTAGDLLKDAGKTALKGLSGLNPFGHHGTCNGDKVEHVTQTSWKTKTKEVTATKTIQSTRTETATKTVQTTRTQTAHTTEVHLKTESSTRILTTTRTVQTTRTQTAHTTKVQSITKTSTKEVTATKTAQATRTAYITNAAVRQDRRNIRHFKDVSGKVIVACGKTDLKNVECWGTDKNSPIKYTHVKDKKFEKCILGDKDTKCLDSGMPKMRLEHFPDNRREVRGIACSPPTKKDDEIHCWGTPKHSQINYHSVDDKKFQSCLGNEKHCWKVEDWLGEQ